MAYCLEDSVSLKGKSRIRPNTPPEEAFLNNFLSELVVYLEYLFISCLNIKLHEWTISFNWLLQQKISFAIKQFALVIGQAKSVS